MVIGAILLLIAALACVAAELFLPSHGVLTICAGLLALGSIIFGYRAHPAFGVALGIAVVVCTPIVFFWAIRVYPSTPMGKRVILKGPPASARDAFAAETQRLSGLVGMRATAATMLRPAGTIEVNGERIDAVSEAEVIAAGTEVEILRVSGLKVIVKGVAPPTATTT
ncbi:MAG: NfeD family protein [Phycisphaerae bacterium]